MTFFLLTCIYLVLTKDNYLEINYFCGFQQTLWSLPSLHSCMTSATFFWVLLSFFLSIFAIVVTLMSYKTKVSSLGKESITEFFERVV